MEKSELDDLDKRLLHALQIEPRASWAGLAAVLGVDAATLARRWKRLSDAGLAWTTGYPTDGHLALLEVRTDPAKTAEIATVMSLNPHAAVVDITSGLRDLMILIRAADLPSISNYVSDQLGALPGVRAVHTHLGNELLIDGAHWRLRSLTIAETEAIPPPRPPRARAARSVPKDLRRIIEREIWLDARVSVADIAERSDFSAQRITDALAVLRSTGVLRLRTDIARSVTDWPIYAWYFLETPASTIRAIRAQIGNVPEIRMALTAASRYNLILAVWLRKLSDVTNFEMALESSLTGARVADRAVVLRTHKHLAHRLDSRSRAGVLVAPPG